MYPQAGKRALARQWENGMKLQGKARFIKNVFDMEDLDKLCILVKIYQKSRIIAKKVDEVKYSNA